MDLPVSFLNEMQQLLQQDYGAFLLEMEKTPVRGLRRNSLKCPEQVLQQEFGRQLQPSTFSPLSYIYSGNEKIGEMPLHHAGAFYSQEPSAASAVTVLNPRPGEKILDLCAAPGGKSTQIGALLQGEGLLWSNEIVKSRANVLLSNIERMGIRNAVVSCCHPQTLCEALTGYFDRVLVDAPCSGEGMFRKDAQAVQEWSPAHSASCAQRQLGILQSAAQAVKQGGVLVYSTCTFSRCENEGVIEEFLRLQPQFTLQEPQVSFGRPGLTQNTLRIYPMDGGEGHFVARLQKTGPQACGAGSFLVPKYGAQEEAGVQLLKQLCTKIPQSAVYRQNDRLLLLPDMLPQLRGLGVLRAGVELGEIRAGRVEPSHAFFMSCLPSQLNSVLCLDSKDPRLQAFLAGEEIDCPLKGYTGVAVNGVLTGFGKASGGRLKNRYPKGLRNMGR